MPVFHQFWKIDWTWNKKESRYLISKRTSSEKERTTKDKKLDVWKAFLRYY